jgi:hypothetical protein
MKATRLIRGFLAAACALITATAAVAADNCTGYDVLVATYAETLDLGNGHTLTAFRQSSILTSENAMYNLTTGECSGAALTTPDGKLRVEGFCARRDKDGHTYSIAFSQAAGADKGTWKATGGTGKFEGKRHSGWFKDVRTDGNMTVSHWGGDCR